MKVITISREYGAGGHTVGRKVAERLGIEFYDRDIITEAAKSSGIEPAQIEKEEESLSKSESFLRAITPISYDSKDTIFNHESQIIVNLAKQGPCVILGRCASVTLEEAGVERLSVFLQATPEQRVKRVGELTGLTEHADIMRQIHKIDTMRHAYFHYYTGRDWATMGDYTLALNTSEIDIETCVDIICQAAGK